MTLDGESMAAKIAPMLVDLSTALAPIKEHASGYREGLVRGGWSQQAAEMMAVQVHNSLIEMIFRETK